jgi:hypothetical protein
VPPAKVLPARLDSGTNNVDKMNGTHLATQGLCVTVMLRSQFQDVVKIQITNVRFDHFFRWLAM